MSNMPSQMKALRGGVYQERFDRKRKRRALTAAKHRHFHKNPAMLELAPLPEPKTRKLGIGEQLHVRRRNWLRNRRAWLSLSRSKAKAA